MGKTLDFNSFQTTFNKLIRQAKNDLVKVNIEFYHHDFQGEPFIHLEANVDNVTIERVDDHGKVISIFTPESTFSFSEKNYYTNLSNDDVVFSSKNNEETYCFISFI